jgi:hypothetical protein
VIPVYVSERLPYEIIPATSILSRRNGFQCKVIVEFDSKCDRVVLAAAPPWMAAAPSIVGEKNDRVWGFTLRAIAPDQVSESCHDLVKLDATLDGKRCEIKIPVLLLRPASGDLGVQRKEN